MAGEDQDPTGGRRSAFVELSAQEFGRMIEQIRQFANSMHEFKETLREMHAVFARQKEVDEMKAEMKELAKKVGSYSMLEKIIFAVIIAVILGAWGLKG